jgi:C4-dicarboxylate-specific signal transduction histidine kinase
MGRIVDSIRTFGHGSPVPHHTICLSEPIREALALLGDSLRSAEIEVAVQVSDEAPAIRGNSELLQQVFINLLSNSRDALTFGVTKRSRRIEIELCPHAGGTRAIVRDTGPGVPPEHVQRIFDPFYTTKAIGRGTGLGLAISHGIVTDHRGNLSYRDADSGGAEFVADFPAAEAPEITAGPHP